MTNKQNLQKIRRALDKLIRDTAKNDVLVWNDLSEADVLLARAERFIK